LIYYI